MAVSVITSGPLAPLVGETGPNCVRQQTVSCVYYLSTLLCAPVCVANMVACASSATAIKVCIKPIPLRPSSSSNPPEEHLSLLLCPCTLPFFHRSCPCQPQCSTALLGDCLVCYNKSQKVLVDTRSGSREGERGRGWQQRYRAAGSSKETVVGDECKRRSSWHGGTVHSRLHWPPPSI